MTRKGVATSLRRFLSAATVTIVLVGGITAFSPAANAADAFACEIHIGGTSESYEVVKGYGSIGSGCVGWTVNVRIQRSRAWPILWETMKSARITGPGYDQYVYYNCAGTGTHDFRTSVWAERNNPWGQKEKTSAVLYEVVC